jgi:hypothetical protein
MDPQQTNYQNRCPGMLPAIQRQAQFITSQRLSTYDLPIYSGLISLAKILFISMDQTPSNHLGVYNFVRHGNCANGKTEVHDDHSSLEGKFPRGRIDEEDHG